MSKKKGLSFDEKTVKLVEILQAKDEPMLQKEIEKAAAKAGISIADAKVCKKLLDTVVADGLAESDKLGTSTFFWSFPITAGVKRKSKVTNLEKSVAAKRKELQKLQEENEKLGANKGESSGRAEKMKALSELEHEVAELDKNLAQYADADPALYAQFRDDAEICYENANRWTDNFFLLEKLCKEKFGVTGDEFRKVAELGPKEFDYLDEEIIRNVRAKH